VEFDGDESQVLALLYGKVYGKNMRLRDAARNGVKQQKSQVIVFIGLFSDFVRLSDTK
jgi:hypothetical protein